MIENAPQINIQFRQHKILSASVRPQAVDGVDIAGRDGIYHRCPSRGSMNMPAETEAYLPAISRLAADIEAQEAKLAEMKRMVNMLCGYAGLAARYPNIDTGAREESIANIKSDQFYGKPQATAVREYLEMRGAPSAGGLGAASVREIYKALKDGGFAFDTKNEDNAMRGLRISLAKNSTTFHRLPNGQFGLLSWYPKVPKSSLPPEPVEPKVAAFDGPQDGGTDDEAANAPHASAA